MRFLSAVIILFAGCVYCLGQNSAVPSGANVTDASGLRQGRWVYWIDGDFNIVVDKTMAKYYREIEFKDDVPAGVTKDYYANGVLFQEFTLLTFKPYGKSGYVEDIDYEKPWKVYWEDGSENLIAPNRIQADRYFGAGKYELAQPFAEKALAATEAKLGKNNWRYSYFLTRLGKIHEALGSYTRAEPLFIEASKIDDGPNARKMDYVGSKWSLAELYFLMGNYAKTEALYKESLARAEQVGGKKSAAYAQSLRGLAKVYNQTHLFRKAKPIYAECLALREENIGAENKEQDGYYADLLFDLGISCARLGEVARATELIQHSTTIIEKRWGKNYIDYSQHLDWLASLAEKSGNNQKAQSLYQEAIDIFEKNGGKDDRAMAGFCMDFAFALFHSQKDNARADSYALKCKNGYMEQIVNFFPSLSEFEKEVFYASVHRFFQYFNAYCLMRKDGNPAILAEMYNNQLATKALLLNSAYKWKQRIRNSGDKKLFALYSEWESNQGLLARLLKTEDGSKRKKMDSIKQVVNLQEKELSRRSEFFATLSEKKNTSWTDIKAKLKPGEVAIEIIRVPEYGVVYSTIDSSDAKLPRYHQHGLTDRVNYAALLITATSNVPELVLLKNGNELENKFFKFYSNSIQTRQEDNESYNRFWKPVVDKLDKLVKKPVGGIHIYLSADGIYNKINLNTLYNPVSKKHVLDEMKISLVTNTKDLLLPQKEEVYNNLAYLFGYPDYGVSVDERSKVVEKTRAAEPLYYALALQRGSNLSELPATKTEVESISKLMTNKGWQPEVFMGKEALEETLKDSFKPRVLHIATHGYFRSDSTNSSNPLLRSGLMLAGAAETLEGKKDDRHEDGILTAYEAMNLNLDNTDLVVLSACETGLGVDDNSEGVSGLQRAFKVAGAKTIVMSLWKVDDQATQELMTAFYDNWLSTQSKRAAFDRAQQQVRAKYKSAYYWGAFVLVGD